MINLVWLKRDLRLHDHRPLVEALKGGHPCILLYVFEPQYWQLEDTSARQWQFIVESLQALNAELSKQNRKLWIAHGRMWDVLDSLHQSIGIRALYSHQETGNAWTYDRDKGVGQWCKTHDIPWHEFAQFGVKRGPIDRDDWDAIWQDQMSEKVLPCPSLDKLIPPPAEYADIPKRYPGNDNAFTKQAQKGGRQTGLRVLQSFFDSRHRQYLSSVSSVHTGPKNSSRLSPYLAYGCLSMKEVVQSCRHQLAHTSDTRSLAAFKSRLHWHCHFIQKMESEPEYETGPVHRDLAALREDCWDLQRFDAWRDGITGIPFIDACMRMLIHSGWLPFRMRAMLTAFSSYHLWLPWQKPAAHLAKLFVDYEPGIHYPQIQMQSGTTGINPFRIYNPVKQGLRFDADGRFIRRWLPELASVEDAYIHEPWLSTRLRQDCYPLPVVMPEQAAREARDRMHRFYQRHVSQAETQRIVQQHASRRYRKKTPRPAMPDNQQMRLF
ncbi:FAD-binding domain-containing protein [Aliiglaciecola sp. CAU 1673]|uniref:FAD-binding domain-containing protein n=1 Tax=Aliiglaciecola sp. CAU 1673 TaxID=3032595 RepID=UPI0023DC8359|nr:FAD-binding domain-containing protein [Aliiglaciecola sp. CAU 1673]MDF2180047.1 FAD-binding domain-containing protein [Aliiglaciecola sp. CAU 1673]